MDQSFLPTQIAEVKRFFAVFANPPAITNEDSDIINIEGGGISIAKTFERVSSIGVMGFRYRVYDHEGQDDGEVYVHLLDAVEVAMVNYTKELFRRVDDQIATGAQATLPNA